jgi:SAM-dependent methyltransferase
MLNIGAGRSLSVESQLASKCDGFVVDRVDVDDPTVEGEHVGECWAASVERMLDVPSETYDVAFANYVFEHVADLGAAAREVRRVLKPGAVFVATVPNPQAPEMRVSALTPLWLHNLVRGRESWPTVYAFRNPDDLAAIMEAHGFRRRSVERFSCAASYLGRFPVIGTMARFYDRVVTRLGLRFLMGNACIVWVAV